jgi:hypothetical protein
VQACRDLGLCQSNDIEFTDLTIKRITRTITQGYTEYTWTCGGRVDSSQYEEAKQLCGDIFLNERVFRVTDKF